jgi:hypothetical protein
MLALRAKYDGKVVHFSEETQGIPPCNVIVLFEEDHPAEDAGWLKAQEESLAKVWNNEEDSVYDQL